MFLFILDIALVLTMGSAVRRGRAARSRLQRSEKSRDVVLEKIRSTRRSLESSNQCLQKSEKEWADYRQALDAEQRSIGSSKSRIAFLLSNAAQLETREAKERSELDQVTNVLERERKNLASAKWAIEGLRNKVKRREAQIEEKKGKVAEIESQLETLQASNGDGAEKKATGQSTVYRPPNRRYGLRRG